MGDGTGKSGYTGVIGYTCDKVQHPVFYETGHVL
jgi:hypothetical protein